MTKGASSSRSVTGTMAGLVDCAAITESAILANIAIRAGKPIEWDAQNMRIPNAPEAEQLLKSEYRPGWSL